MSWFFELDWSALHFFNQTLAHPYLDRFFLTITNLHREAWAVYGLLPVLIFALWKFYGVGALRAIFVVAVVVGFGDFVNHRVIKPLVARERPFVQDQARVQVRLGYEPRGYSFPSNHAVNNMAGATVLAAFMPALAPIFYGYAVLVGVSRPYLGVHFPSDILFGFLLGWLVAQGFLLILRHRWAPWFERHGS